MSDEPSQPPPPLRLKPRLRPPDASAPPPVLSASTPLPVAEPTPATPPPAPAPFSPTVPAAPKLRIRPSLIPSEAAPPPPAFIPPAPVAAFVPPPPAVEPTGNPAEVPPGVIAPGLDSAKFRLKPKVPPPPGSPPPLAPTSALVPPLFAPPLSSEPGAKVPPPFPVVAPSRRTGNTNFPVPHIRVKADVPEASASPAPEPQEKKRVSKLAILGLATVVVLGGAFAWMKFGAERPAPAPAEPASATPVATAPKTTPTPAPVVAASATPSETLNALAHAPKNAINKAQDVVTGQRAKEQARVDAIAEGEEPPKKATSPAGASTKSATTVRSLAPGISATTEIDVATEGSPAFRSFMANARINGVEAGASPKVFINGRLVRTGQVVDANLGIIFDRIEAEKRLLVFKDRSGTIATRKY